MWEAVPARSSYRHLSGIRANLQESINTSALLAIYPGECYATTNLREQDLDEAARGAISSNPVFLSLVYVYLFGEAHNQLRNRGLWQAGT